MARFIKWTAIAAAAVTGASFAYAAVQAARRKIDRGLQQAEQMAQDAQHVTVDPALAARPGTDLETGAAATLSGGLDMPAYSWRIIELK